MRRQRLVTGVHRFLVTRDAFEKKDPTVQMNVNARALPVGRGDGRAGDGEVTVLVEVPENSVAEGDAIDEMPVDAAQPVFRLVDKYDAGQPVSDAFVVGRWIEGGVWTEGDTGAFAIHAVR